MKPVFEQFAEWLHKIDMLMAMASIYLNVYLGRPAFVLASAAIAIILSICPNHHSDNHRQPQAPPPQQSQEALLRRVTGTPGNEVESEALEETE